MNVETLIQELKNNILPEVKTERIVNWDGLSGGWFGLLEHIGERHKLQFIHQRGKTYRFKFSGNWIIDRFQWDIFSGAIPDPDPYRDLQAYLELTPIGNNQVYLKIFERMIGTSGEQKAFRQVLEERMEEVVAHLSNKYGNRDSRQN